MSTINYVPVLLLLPLLFGLCNASFVTIHILNILPDDVLLFCTSQPGINAHLHPQNPFYWSFPAETSENCFTDWHELRAPFSAYDSHYDQGHPNIYWMVKKDGLYHSWDNKSFVKKVGWN